MPIQKIIDLGAELAGDPEILGYSAPPVDPFDEAAAAADMAIINAVNRPVNVETLSGSQLFEAIDDTEWQALPADAKSDIQFVVSLGDNIQIAPGTKARTMLARALASSPTSLGALGVLGTKNVSRAEELGLGKVTIGNIQLARRDAP